MGLQEYRHKRDFRRTPEPRGERRTSGRKRQFVIQKHDASRLHYDFRLELDGVLKSWAVPKGPSLDPAVKALAVEVEDHPLDYATFEGIIPAGEYGGGTVLVWDRGTWESEDSDPAAALMKGHLRFQLRGRKLKGGWSLIRIRGEGERNNWLLIKRGDRTAIPGDSHGILKRQPNSVVTRRGLVQVAKSADREWTAASPAVQVTARRTLARAGKGEATRSARAAQRQAGARDDVPKPSGRSTSQRGTSSMSAEFAGVTLTHPDRVLFPDIGITKADLARYYEQAAEWVLPHVVDRPLSLVRCPAGNTGQCFYQKHWTDSLPEDIEWVRVRKKTGAERYVKISDLAGLMSLVQISVLEIHPWGARADDIEQPDRIVIDLDPGDGVEWSAVVQGARDVRTLLDTLELDAFVRTSGGKGLHVVVPLRRSNSWQEVEAFAHHIASAMTHRAGHRYVANMRKALRKGRIYVDYLRNQRGATAVAAYSTRHRPGCPIAMPLSWKDLAKVKSASAFTIENVPRRLARLRRDPWEGFFTARQTLTKRLQERAAKLAASDDD